jgi:molecular chaperone DnaK
MVKDAEAHAGEDKKRKELVEAKNQGDALIHSTEKALADYGDKVSAEEKGAIETAIADLKSALESEDAEAISAKHQALLQASMKLGEAMYKASAESAGAEGSGQADDGVVDAEFEEVDDNKSA